MFPVKKAEENKFILTAPTEFPSPKFVLLVLCSPTCGIRTVVHCMFEAQCRRGAGSGWNSFCSPSTPSLSCLTPGFNPVSTRAENTGEHIDSDPTLLVTLQVGMRLILAAPPSALPQVHSSCRNCVAPRLLKLKLSGSGSGFLSIKREYQHYPSTAASGDWEEKGTGTLGLGW